MKLSEAKELARVKLLLDEGVLSREEKSSLKAQYENELLFLKGNGLSEFYQEMEMTDKYIDAHTDKSESKDIIGLHSHSFYEILLITNGEIQYLINNKRYKVSKGDILVIPPGVSHKPLFLEKLVTPYERTVIWMNYNFVQSNIEMMKSIEEGHDLNHKIPHVIRTHGSQLNKFKRLISLLLEEKSSKLPGSEYSSIGIAIQLISHFIIYSSYKENELLESEDAALIDHIMTYIENNFVYNISLQSISNELRISETTINNTLRVQMDTSFYRLVTSRRLIEAKNYILKKVPLKQIPQLCGYNDYSVFYKAFIKEYGVSPSTYRNKDY